MRASAHAAVKARDGGHKSGTKALAAQRQVKALEAHRHQKRRSLFEAQDDIDKKRAVLIEEVEQRLAQKSATALLFTFRWRLE